MKTRRSFIGWAIALLGGSAVAQKGITQNGQAVICDGNSVTCPACKQKTCKILNLPIVLGNDNREYPDQAQMFEYKILCCQNCRAAFFA